MRNLKMKPIKSSIPNKIYTGYAARKVSLFSRIRIEYEEIWSMNRENVDQNNPKYGHILRSVTHPVIGIMQKTSGTHK